MATESLLVKTRDNRVIVFNINYDSAQERQRLVYQCEKTCNNNDYADIDFESLNFPGVELDSENTDLLHENIAGYQYVRQPEKFFNEVKETNIPTEMNKPNVLHLDYDVSDDIFPEIIKNIGFAVKPDDKIYQVVFDKNTGCYVKKNFNARRAYVRHDSKELFVCRKHLEFAPKDYQRLQQMIADFKRKKILNPKLTPAEYSQNNIRDIKDHNLFDIYATEQTIADNISSIINHETHHVKNEIFRKGLSLKDSHRRMSVEDLYRIEVEDERSAYLGELIYSLNRYLKNGDYDDFSMFKGNTFAFGEKLKSQTDYQQRLIMSTDYNEIIGYVFDLFQKKYRDLYDKTQFKRNLLEYVNFEQLNAPLDTEREYFKQIRSLYYNYNIYNPDTQKMENINLSKYITEDMEVDIPSEVKKCTIIPAKKILAKRIKEFTKKRDKGKINPDFIAVAKRLMRGALHSNTYINCVDGFMISDLQEELKDSGNSKDIPNDKADWSDGLESYWSKIDGYKEIAKNNEEYSFMINDTQLRYKDQNHVDVSCADFDVYVKVLKEPSVKNKVIEFDDTLSKEEALTLYIACINNGRNMKGAVPKDLSGINKLKGIPLEEMNKFKHRMAAMQNNNSLCKNTLTSLLNHAKNRTR